MIKNKGIEIIKEVRLKNKPTTLKFNALNIPNERNKITKAIKIDKNIVGMKILPIFVTLLINPKRLILAKNPIVEPQFCGSTAMILNFNSSP